LSCAGYQAMSTFEAMRGLTLQPNLLFFPITNMKLPACTLIPRVSKVCLNEYQDIWNCDMSKETPFCLLHCCTIGIVTHNKNISCDYARLINRLHIGHCCVTQSYFLSGDDLPMCGFCGLSITAECSKPWDIGEKYFTVKELFQSVNSHMIINFIKESHFYNQL